MTGTLAGAPPATADGDPPRVRPPDRSGYVDREGVRIWYEVFGDGANTILLMPTWPIVHSRMWKAQVPYLARLHRVVTFDPRGNGRSDRPQVPEAYSDDEYVADTLAVMDETGTDRALLVALCAGVRWSVETAVEQPQRVQGIVALEPGVPLLTPPHPHRAAAAATFDEVVDDVAGWPAKENRHYWRRDYRGWVESHSGPGIMLPEPHSTRQYEDLVAWAMDTDAETLLAVHDCPPGRVFPGSKEEVERVCSTLRCPLLVVHGSADLCQPISRAERLAEVTGAQMVVIEGGGHAPMARHPVKVNLLIKEFADSVFSTPAAARTPPPTPPRAATRRRRPKRVLYLSSPIGLGHAMRDLAIAREIRALHPDAQIDWLTQHPVTMVLDAHGERVHPASQHLASESAHIESESAEHDVHVFQAIRRMDEILVANFMVFHELLRDEAYDLVVGDEAWDVDHFWHENPELKRSAFCWMTDFVGWLPMPDGGDGEATLTADYNAEMLEHIARLPQLRDRSVFVGNPDDIVPGDFGPGLPSIREWTQRHYDFSGYITGFDPAALDRNALRAELGYRDGERVCIVTVGGSGVGEALLRKVSLAYPEAKRLVPGLRMILVAGPRIAPESLPHHNGLEIRGHLHSLYRHLAACDMAVVQGGLSTTMELTALKVPFLYFPLRHHFEQNFHVRHRLQRYGAGRCMDYAESTPEIIAAAIAAEIDKPVRCRDVETDGAARAARLIAELL